MKPRTDELQTLVETWKGDFVPLEQVKLLQGLQHKLVRQLWSTDSVLAAVEAVEQLIGDLNPSAAKARTLLEQIPAPLRTWTNIAGPGGKQKVAKWQGHLSRALAVVVAGVAAFAVADEPPQEEGLEADETEEVEPEEELSELQIAEIAAAIASSA